MGLIKKFRIKGFKNKLPIAKLDKISLSFAKRQILDNISFNLNSGEIVGLLGPNGAGKSTIFNILMGLVKPDFGKIIIEGDDATSYPIYLRAKKFKIGYVPQYGGYFNDLSLLENLKKRIKYRTNILLVHGDQDDILSPTHLLEAKDFFLRENVEIETHLIKNCTHHIPIEASSLALNFIKKNLEIN